MLKVFVPIYVALPSSKILCTLIFVRSLSDGVFVFLRKLRSRLDDDCNRFLHWTTGLEQHRHPVVEEVDCRQHVSPLVGHVLVGVQRVMLRHDSCREGGKAMVIRF